MVDAVAAVMPVYTSDPPFSAGRGSHARRAAPPGAYAARSSAGSSGSLDDRGGGLTAVGRQESHDGRREDDERADQECALVAVGRGLSEAVAGAQDRLRLCGGDRREDRQPERGTELLAGVEQPGGETGLVLVDAGVRRRRQRR